MRYSKHYIIGCSVGVGAQSSSIAVIEQESKSHGLEAGHVTELRLRLIERLPMDATHPQLAKRLRDIKGALVEQDSAKNPSLLVDVTGTGSSVIKYFETETLAPIQVLISSGYGVSQLETNKWRISKTELVGPLQLRLHESTFRIADKLELAEQFKAELANWRPKAIPMNGNDIEAWREGKADDLVFAVALATWWSDRDIPMSTESMAELERRLNPPGKVSRYT